MVKKSNFISYKVNNQLVITDLFKQKSKNDSLVNKIFKYANDKTGNNIILEKDPSSFNKDSVILKTLKYVNKKLGIFPYKKIIISTKNISRRPIYGLNNFPEAISPFSQSFLYEFNFLKELCKVYFIT